MGGPRKRAESRKGVSEWGGVKEGEGQKEGGAKEEGGAKVGRRRCQGRGGAKSEKRFGSKRF